MEVETTTNQVPEAKQEVPGAPQPKGSRRRRRRPENSTGGQRKKRRRGKTKSKQKIIRTGIPGHPPVPYNTNRFLMEYHQPELEEGEPRSEFRPLS